MATEHGVQSTQDEYRQILENLNDLERSQKEIKGVRDKAAALREVESRYYQQVFEKEDIVTQLQKTLVEKCSQFLSKRDVLISKLEKADSENKYYQDALQKAQQQNKILVTELKKAKKVAIPQAKLVSTEHAQELTLRSTATLDQLRTLQAEIAAFRQESTLQLKTLRLANKWRLRNEKLSSDFQKVKRALENTQARLKGSESELWKKSENILRTLQERDDLRDELSIAHTKVEQLKDEVHSLKEMLKVNFQARYEQQKQDLAQTEHQLKTVQGNYDSQLTQNSRNVVASVIPNDGPPTLERMLDIGSHNQSNAVVGAGIEVQMRDCSDDHDLANDADSENTSDGSMMADEVEISPSSPRGVTPSLLKRRVSTLEAERAVSKIQCRSPEPGAETPKRFKIYSPNNVREKIYTFEGSRPSYFTDSTPEDVVVRSRPGRYGNYKCPLCPCHYTSLAGFSSHCGHKHREYRKAFRFMKLEDLLKCNNCLDGFTDLDVFHNHLNDGRTCTQPARVDVVPQRHPVGASNRSRPSEFTKLIGKNPRSARLQNHLATVTASAEQDSVDEDSFDLVTCPICEEAAIANFTEHIMSSHPELDLQFRRMDSSTLRCKSCGILFAICDVLAHSRSCIGSKSLIHVAEKRATKFAKSKAVAKPKTNMLIPPGIGTSSVEKMDNEDLTSLDVLRRALKCGVCNRVEKKMNTIAECLRRHGIYRCFICFNSFFFDGQKSDHLKKCHKNGEGRFKCPLCPTTAVSGASLTTHMLAAHWRRVLDSIGAEILDNKRSNQFQDETSGTATNKAVIPDSTTDSTTPDAGPVVSSTFAEVEMPTVLSGMRPENALGMGICENTFGNPSLFVVGETIEVTSS